MLIERKKIISLRIKQSLFTKLYPRILVPSLVEVGPFGSQEEDFKISSMCFRFILIIPTWKLKWPFI